MKVSIALASFNGGHYLKEQLDSFTNQTRIPDELVICDDGSTDGSQSIIEEFSERAPFDVRLERNECNLGYARNFEKCMALCNGDVVFMSDQDDVWFPEKIAQVMSHFSGGEELKVTINDQEITDSELTRTGKTIFGNSDHLGFGEQWLSAGCCTAMSRTFVSLALPFPRGSVSHDGWIHMLAKALEIRIVIPQVLQLYRRHGSNTSDPLAVRNVAFPVLAVLQAHGMRVSIEAWVAQLLSSDTLIQRLERGLREIVARDAVTSVGSVNRFHKALARERLRRELIHQRLRLLRRSRISRIAAICKFHSGGGYGFFQGWRSAVKDALRPPISAEQLRAVTDSLRDRGNLE